LTASQILLEDSEIATLAEQGDGGDIVIGPGELLLADRSSITTEVKSGVGNGGNIRIDPEVTVLASSEVIADAFGGNGGNINLNSDYLIQDPDSIIRASSQLGDEGVIDIQSPEVTIVSSLTPLPADFLAAAEMFKPRCEARESDEGGSLVVAARGGLPASPEGLLLAFDVPAELPAEVAAAAPDVAAPGERRGPVVDARSASRRGSQAFRGGRFDEASSSFEAASDIYRDAGDAAAFARNLEGLSQARQAMGDYRGAMQSLQQALAAAEDSGDQALVASTLGSIGNTYIALEEPELARSNLSRGIELAKDVERPEVAAVILTNLGNLQVTLGDVDGSLESYLESAALSEQSDRHLQAAQAYSSAARVALRAEKTGLAGELLTSAGDRLSEVEPSHGRVYVLIHAARTRHQLAESLSERQSDQLRRAHDALKQATRDAEALGDDRALAYCHGNMAELYRSQQRLDEALLLSRMAIAAAERAEALESLYRWHWQAGRILWSQGRSQDAIDSYRRAVAILRETRQETAYSYLRSESSFRDSVGPVYMDLVDALLQSSETLDDPQRAAQLLLEARATVEHLKAAELRDYFRDECVADLEARSIPVESISERAAVIYPIVLPDRLELLVSGPQKLQRYTVPVPESEFTAEVARFRRALNQSASRRYLEPGQRLYEWLVQPYEVTLSEAGVDTLVFVPGSALRTIPMSALHDGNDFLIRKYAVAVTPSLALTDPQSLDRASPRLLLAGLSESVQGFPSLDYVPAEVGAIHELYGGRLLLNEQFTREGMEESLQDRELSIVHIASHGTFTGNPDDSFLLTYDGRISMDQLGDYVGQARFRETPLELLVLSACQTAAGDDRAALGLAGVAIKSGARSALGSLWSINDEATAELVAEFYRQLQDPALTRAQALQRAQLKLVDGEQFRHPNYWSAFLLISNWL
jgi:CHAT domain-containing protein